VQKIVELSCVVHYSLLDRPIRENVLLDIRENVEWPRFLAHPVGVPTPSKVTPMIKTRKD